MAATMCYHAHMKTNDSLKKLGLKANEISIYTYLLRTGESSGKKIYRSLNIDKSATYRALTDLQKKGLVYALGQNRNQTFGANDSNSLQKIVKQKQRELKKVESDVANLIDDISEYAKSNYKSKNIQVYEGKEGYKLWSEERLYKENSTIRHFLFQNSIEKYFDNYHEYMDNYIARRVKKGIDMRYIYDNSEMGSDIAITDKKELKESREYSGKSKVNASFSTFGEKCGFYTDDTGKFMGIIIDDPLIAKLLSGVFDQIWENAKTTDRS